MSFIWSIDTAMPKYKHSQSVIFSYMKSQYNPEVTDLQRLKLMYERSGIDYRYSVIPDFDVNQPKKELFKDGLQPDVTSRLSCYHAHATTLAEAAINNCLKSIPGENEQSFTHLITVSCTGMSAPGLDIELVKRLHLPSNINRTSVNFMGCYAMIHAFKQAHAICTANKNALVMIVSVELCTLHFQKNPSADNLTANAIFADGAAACVIAGDAYRDACKEPYFELIDFYSEIIPNGEKDMAWHISSEGFLMTLSAYIPSLIEQHIETLFNQCLRGKLTLDDIELWAIHPGGRKILDVIQSQLKLPKQALDASYEVLRNYGNMSSATILFVLKKLLQSNQTGKTFGVAFGPGLTMESFLFEKYV